MRAAILFALIASPSCAQEVTYRLSDAERDAVVAAAAEGPERAPVLTQVQQRPMSVLDRPLYPEFYASDAAAPGADRRVHGEMGVFAGSRGLLGTYGSVSAPLGERAWGSFSWMQSQGGGPYLGGFGGFGFQGRWRP